MTLLIAIALYIAFAIAIGKLLAYASSASDAEIAERRLAAALGERPPTGRLAAGSLRTRRAGEATAREEAEREPALHR